MTGRPDTALPDDTRDEPAAWLAGAAIDPAVRELRPDYRAVLVLAENLVPGPGDAISEALLAEAEAHCRRRDAGGEPHPHVVAWREAFRSFGSKPRRFRPSVDALLRRVPDGLPRIDRLTDAYNAVSVTHVLPLGGEDADAYQSPPRLVRAAGDEPFDTVAGGEPVTESPDPGEVVWRDDAGVTCRRWNWRQCVRTRLTTATSRALFVMDALGALTDPELSTATDALIDALRRTSPEATFTTRALTR
jgi:DNA/RNA-binding domain of Phe-tRNA-synthetase-like protein